MTNFSCQGIRSELSQRYEVLLNMAPFGFLLVDLSGEIVEVNRTAIKMLGSPSEEDTRAINLLSYEPLEKVGVSQLVRDAISCVHPVTRIFDYVTKWDKAVTLKCTACSIQDSCGEVCFVAFLMEDISLLEQMKIKYYKMARTLASVVDTIESHYIWAKDRDGIYQVVSKSYADLFHKTPQDIVGWTDYDLFDKDSADSYIEDDQIVLSTCGAKEISEIVTTPKHGERHWRTMKNAICNEAGEGIVTVGIAEDVTADVERRKVAENAIKDLEAFVKRNSG